MNRNNLTHNLAATVMFIDMNSFFASCEQQVNYWLRGRPVGVCVYTGKHGCIIASSIEAKLKGVKTGMRLSDAMPLCPELVPIETHPARYREFYLKFIEVLKSYSNEVLPKSIDEAIIDFTNYGLVYKDLPKLARQIKQDIKTKVGDWMKCSIGIAPNVFLAKLASDIQKPDGLVCITPQNIDEVLKKLSLQTLPGIAGAMAAKLERAGIKTPLELRYADPVFLHKSLKSIVGYHWHCRLNFKEVDMMSHDYKSMQAMRQISAANRQSLEYLNELLLSLCMTLERRMVQQEVFCTEVNIFTRYENDYSWKDHFKIPRPLQDGTELLNLIKLHMTHYEKAHQCEPIINTNLTALSVSVQNFMTADMVQYDLFDNNHIRKDSLRKVVYQMKGKYGNDAIQKAIELQDAKVLKDVIGFGSIKDLHAENSD